MARWLWCAWIVRPCGEKLPFYGFTAETQSPERSASTESVDLPSGAVLQISDVVLPDKDLLPLLSSLKDDLVEIDLSSFLTNAPKIPVRYSREIITKAFAHGAVYSLVKYGMPDLDRLFADAEDVAALLEACTTRLGLSFRDELASHLGGFDKFEMGPWLEAPPPYGMHVLKNVPQPQSDGVRIWRANIVEDEVAHLTLQSDDETVFDQIVILKTGESFADLKITTIPDWMELRLFHAASGKLVFRESNHFIREVGMNIVTPGPTIHLSDKLSKKAKSVKGLGQSATATTAMRSMQSTIGLDPTNLRAYRRELMARLDRATVSETADRWFPRGLSGEIAAIDYLNALIGQGHVREAILVDPFFGADALERVMLRIRQSGLKITVVASWGRTDPDTNLSLIHI